MILGDFNATVGEGKGKKRILLASMDLELEIQEEKSN